MAEAMCGPSNALSQFKQHTSVDRTLQQDRFTSRRGQPQGFRSSSRNATRLDPEFEAFQAGMGTPPMLDHMQPFQGPAQLAPPSAAPSWADDFQRMSLSPQPFMQQTPQLFPAAASASAPSWTQGFHEQFKQTAPRASSPSPLAFQQMARYGASGFQSSFTQPSFLSEAPMAKGKAPAVDAFDEAAFERAFDLAREDMMADAVVEQQATTAESVLESQDSLTADAQAAETIAQPDTIDDFMHGHEASTLEQDFHQNPTVQEEMVLEEDLLDEMPEDDDALAATAQELLIKVEHNQSDKFKNSQFFGLMRKLADRQVRVEGDKMVETADASSSSHAGTTLNRPPSTSHLGTSAPLAATASAATQPYGEAPLHQQNLINPQDGQDVINLLNDPNLADEIGPYTMPRTATDDVDFDPQFSETWSI